MSNYGELINIRSLSPAIRLSAASGLVWAVIAWFIGYRIFEYRIWGGIIMAPLIGILIGRLARPMHNKPLWVQIPGSLFYLYIAAVSFAIAMAVFSPVAGPRERFSAVLMPHVWAILWGLTFGGYAVVLWPVSFFNHRLVWQADAGHIPTRPEVRTTTPAVRRLAVRMMALSVLGYAAWTLFQAALASVGSSVSTMLPWWLVTGLMGWSKWFVLGVFVWLSAPVLVFAATRAAGSKEGSTATYRELMGVAGFAVCVFPIFSFAAMLLVTAIKVSLVESWATEGTVFWSADYYRNVLRLYRPWFLVGGGMIGLKWLMDVRR